MTSGSCLNRWCPCSTAAIRSQRRPSSALLAQLAELDLQRASAPDRSLDAEGTQRGRLNCVSKPQEGCASETLLTKQPP
jgi:hypothetical protein